MSAYALLLFPMAQEDILELMEREPTRWWTRNEIIAALPDKGKNTVAANLARCVKGRFIEMERSSDYHARHHVYRYIHRGDSL